MYKTYKPTTKDRMLEMQDRITSIIECSVGDNFHNNNFSLALKKGVIVKLILKRKWIMTKKGRKYYYSCNVESIDNI